MALEAIFEPPPAQWGLRGDPQLWRALSEAVSGVVVPTSDGDVEALLLAHIHRLTGIDLPRETREIVVVPSLAVTRPPEGMISPKTWRETLLPLLLTRAARLRESAPPAT